jgi:hypothetical protein
MLARGCLGGNERASGPWLLNMPVPDIRRTNTFPWTGRAEQLGRRATRAIIRLFAMRRVS